MRSINDSDGLNQIQVAVGQKSLLNESLYKVFVSDRDFLKHFVSKNVL